MGAQLGGEGTMSEMNLTPLIDIVLVVLIIMMVNMPIEIEEMGVKLPALNKPPKPPTDDNNIEQLVIAVYDPEAEDEDPKLALNRRLITEDQLFVEVTRRLRPMSEKNVFIDAGTTVPYGRVVDMMDLAREAGADKVGLARMKEGGPATPTSVSRGTIPRGVLIGQPTVVGAFDSVKADEVMQGYVKHLQGCYYPHLSAHPEMSGRMMIRFTLGPDGQHMDEKISTNSVEPKVEAMTRCVAEKVMPSVEFPPLGEGKTAIVQYPVLYSPG